MEFCLYHYRIMQEHQIALKSRQMSLMSGSARAAKDRNVHAQERDYQRGICIQIDDWSY